jgi:hypothetical protein
VCDAVYAQDAATCYELASRYPDVTRVLAAHSRDHALQGIPQRADVCDGAVVFNDRVRHWVESHACHPPVTRLRQPVDLKRFLNLGGPRLRPRRVLISSNYIVGARAELIHRACRAAGLQADRIGAPAHPTSTPERAIADADIVIGQGRTVVEAMAAGRPAFVYGIVGGDGWVTRESYSRLEADGFGGLSSDSVVDRSSLESDLHGWHADMGELNRDLACAHHDARDHVVELVDLVRRLDRASANDRPGDASSQLDELARLVRLEWRARGIASAAAAEARELRSELERQRQDTRVAQEAARETQRQLRELVATRRYRFARTLAAPLDRVRAIRGRHAG